MSRSPAEMAEEFPCKKCGQPVRFAQIGYQGASFEAERVESGGYELTEEINSSDEFTGRWLAKYVKLADRDESPRFRRHACAPIPMFDARDMAPVMIKNVWVIVSKASMQTRIPKA